MDKDEWYKEFRVQNLNKIMKAITSEEDLQEIFLDIFEGVSKLQREIVFYELDNNWCSRNKDYDKHECNGQDGADISFTKKDFEVIRNKLSH